MNPHDFRRLVLARELLARPPEPGPQKQAEPTPEPAAHLESADPRMAAAHDAED